MKRSRPQETTLFVAAIALVSAAVTILVIEAGLIGLGSVRPHGVGMMGTWDGSVMGRGLGTRGWIVLLVIALEALTLVGAGLVSIAWVLSTRRRSGRPRTSSIALAILQRRLATGAITAEEYERKRRALERHAL